MITFITIIQVIACFLLIASVLVQQPKGGGTVFGGTSQSVFGSSGGTTFMFRVTMWSAALIMVSSLFLAWYRNSEARNTVVDSAPIPTQSAAGAPAPGSPVAPAEAPAHTPPPAAAPIAPALPPKK